MNRYMLEEFHNDPALRRRLFESAHRERAHAVSVGLAWLLRQIKARLTPGAGLRQPRWLARLG